MFAVFGRIFFWLSWPALYVYLRGSTRTRVIIESEGAILLIKGWHDGKKWALPGGGMHKNEPAVESALREVREEVGLRLETNQLISLGSDQYSQRGLRYAIVRFGCRLPKKPTIKLQRAEILHAKWFLPADITPLVVEPNVLRQLEAWQQIR